MFDILIVGGGPAGITAGIYAKRAGRKVAIIERLAPGGQVATIGMIENYPGFSKIRGDELSMNFYKQATDLGVEFIYANATAFELKGEVKKVICKDKVYEAKSIILALGSVSKDLNVEGEKKFFGRGVSYCALCDGNFFKGQNVAVVGSGDSSISDAIYLANICKKVYVLAKNNLKLRAHKEEDATKYDNVEIIKNVQVSSIDGNEKIQRISFNEDGVQKSIDVDGVFVAIGRSPDTEALKGQLELDEKGYIKVKDGVKTNIEGVYACGDVAQGVMKQIVVAAGQGALAATEAIIYLAKKVK